MRNVSALALSLIALGAAASDLPPEGRCSVASGGAADELDATRAPLQPGDELTFEQLPALRALLPPEVWRHRDVFFFSGMRLTIGPCHRRYPASRAFEAATRAYAGRARLDAADNLMDHVAGLPFPATSIAANDPRAGARWAWNLERRYRAAGPIGSFRLVDLPDSRALASRTDPQTFVGDFFLVQTGQRADLPNHQVREARRSAWVAGGAFREPPDARGLAWRQLRSLRAAASFRRPDDTFVYLPDAKKMRRAASVWSDGMYAPRYRAAGQGSAGVIPYGQGERLAAIEAGHGRALAATEDIRRGFTGLALRPNAWKWRFIAEREVLAPLNARTEGWPLRAGRNHGPGGLSFASDAWDLRWAVVIEGRARQPQAGIARITYWVDVQTAQPLYVILRRESGEPLELGVLAHRYSGDVPGYPAWPTGDAANVFDPVAAAFLALPSGGWRRESWDVRSLPPETNALRALVTTDALVHGR